MVNGLHRNDTDEERNGKRKDEKLGRETFKKSNSYWKWENKSASIYFYWKTIASMEAIELKKSACINILLSWKQ